MGRRLFGLTCRIVKERAVQSAAIQYIRSLWDPKTIEESWKIGFIVILMKTLSPIVSGLSSIINHQAHSTWWFGEAELGEMKENSLNHFFPSPLHSMSALPKVISALTQRYALFMEDESVSFIS